MVQENHLLFGVVLGSTAQARGCNQCCQLFTFLDGLWFPKSCLKTLSILKVGNYFGKHFWLKAKCEWKDQRLKQTNQPMRMIQTGLVPGSSEQLQFWNNCTFSSGDYSGGQHALLCIILNMFAGKNWTFKYWWWVYLHVSSNQKIGKTKHSVCLPSRSSPNVFFCHFIMHVLFLAHLF